MLVEAAFADVIRQDGDYIVLLLEKSTERLLGIRMDFHEATTIGWIAQGCPDLWAGRGQPGIHKFLRKAMASAGASVAGADIRPAGRGFIARLGITMGGTTETLLAQPSDALAMALLARAPIKADFETTRSAVRNLDAVYSRTALGKPTQALVGTLREMWSAQDARIYANLAEHANGHANGHENGHENGGEDGEAQEIHFVDVLGADPLVKTAVFWSKTGRRMLPVRVPAWDADALAGLSTEASADPQPPHTYRFAAAVLAAAGITVHELEIAAIRDGVLRAVARTEVEGIGRGFDLRPVDAAGLAVALGLPLYASGRVVSEAGVPAGRLYRSKTAVGAGLRARSERSKSPLSRIGSLLRRT